MMNVIKSLLTATCVVSLAATGCVRQDATPTSEIDKAIPTSDQVAIKLPAVRPARSASSRRTTSSRAT